MSDARPRPGQPAMERFVKDEISRQGVSRKAFLTGHGITESTFYRVLQDSPAIGEEQYRRLEGALDLPRNVLDYIAAVDTKRLERAGLEPDQLRVIEDYLEDAVTAAAQAGESDEKLHTSTKRRRAS